MIFSNHRSIFTAVLTSAGFINIDFFLRNLKHGELKELNLATLKRDTYAYLICYIFIFFEKKKVITNTCLKDQENLEKKTITLSLLSLFLTKTLAKLEKMKQNFATL